MTDQLHRHLVTFALTAMLTACGGGGGSTPEVVSGGPLVTDGSDGSGGPIGPDDGSGIGDNTGNPVLGISGSGRAVGVITQFGSIFVNGVEYDTSEAVIVVNGVIATEDDLGVGMVVFVQGTVNEDGVTGVAEVVIVDDNLKGPISEITSATDETGTLLDARQITVLGIDVVVERTGTVFEDTTFETLSTGDFIEIYGFAESGNNIRATRVERENFVAGVTIVEVYGAVDALDTTAETFMLGNYEVNYSAAVFDDIDQSAFVDGLLVEVKGTLDSAEALSIDATKIEPTGIDGGDAEDNGEIEVDTSLNDDDEFTTEGTISGFDATNNTFIISGTRVDASTAQLIPGNLALEDGLIVQVEGTFSGDVLIAEEIKSRRGRIEIEARVSALDESARTVSLNLGVGVLNVAINAQTLMDDDRDNRDQRFNFEDLMVGDFLEIEAIDFDGALVATRVDREDEDEEEISLQAPVDEFVAEESITLLGLQFAVDTNTEYESIGGSEVLASAFFAEISSGFLVKLEDEDPLDGIADELEFKDPSRPDGGYEFDDDDDDDSGSDDDDSSSGDGSSSDDDDSSSDDDESSSDDDACEVASDDSDTADGADSDSSDGSGGATDGSDDTSADDDDDDDDDDEQCSGSQG